jgi:hypothetical protein
VDPAALTKIIGRAFYVKYKKSINARHICAYLNGSGEKPVPLNQLAALVSGAVAALIKGPIERPGRMPDNVAPERPVYMAKSIFQPIDQLTTHRNLCCFVNKKSADYLIQVARGLITPLKGTAPGKHKGTESQICASVFKKMK